MSLKKLSITTFLTFSILAIASCKKEEETTTYPSLDGVVSILGLDEFVDATGNRTLKLKPTGPIHPEGNGLGYCWKVVPLMEKYDTTRYENGLNKKGQESDGSFEYKLKDSLGTYTIYCYAFASGYSSSYAVGYTTLVRAGAGGSITGTGINDDTNDAEYKDYRYVTIGNTDWINTNMYEENNAGAPFRNAPVMSRIFGQYYNYDDAVNACKSLPRDEWQLPTENDWIELAQWLTKGNENAPEIKAYENIYWDKAVNGTPTLASQLMVNGSFNSEEMWTYWPAVGDITNRSGLAFLPTGYANLGVTPAKSGSNYPDATFEGLFDYAVFWTASEVEGEEGMAYYRYIYGTQPHLMIGKGNKETFGASVRCIRRNN